MINTFIFDLEGVIIDSRSANQKTWKDFFDHHNIKLSQQEINQITSDVTAEEVIAKYLKPESQEELQELANQRSRLFKHKYQTKISLVPGIKKFLELSYKLNLNLGIATTSKREYVSKSLYIWGLNRYFSAIITKEQVELGKPNPQIYTKAAQALRTTPQQSLVFEDSQSGVIAANQADMKVIFVETSQSAAVLSQELKIEAAIPNFSNQFPHSFLSKV